MVSPDGAGFGSVSVVMEKSSAVYLSQDPPVSLAHRSRETPDRA